MSGLRWLGALLVAVTLGWVVGLLWPGGLAADAGWYQLLATALLAIGLYGSTASIQLDTAREALVPIVLAVTAGVVLKAGLIMSVMWLVDPDYTVLGLAVAQIDPLSVSAMLARSGMSARARTILLAWSSFDDPVTTLLTIYLAGLLLPGDSDGSGLLGYAGGLLANLGLVVAAGCGWLLLRAGRRLARRRVRPAQPRSGLDRPGAGAARLWWGLELALLAGVLVGAVSGVLMLGLAVVGLFLRPALGRAGPGLLTAALLVAMAALGMLLTGGVAFGRGAVLAGSAFAAQMIAAAVLPARLTRDDRVFLALGQQNGITAVILALALEPRLPGAAATVAPAILLVNLLHLATNAWWDMPWRRRRPGGHPTDPSVQSRPAAS